MARKKTKTKQDKEKPVWLKFNEKDIEAIVLKLAKELTPEKIGLVLRDTYGIPTTKIFGKKIGQILREKNLYKDPTLTNLEKKQEALKKHLEKNKQDKTAKRALTIITARISKLKRYLQKKKR